MTVASCSCPDPGKRISEAPSGHSPFSRRRRRTGDFTLNIALSPVTRERESTITLTACLTSSGFSTDCTSSGSSFQRTLSVGLSTFRVSDVDMMAELIAR